VCIGAELLEHYLWWRLKSSLKHRLVLFPFLLDMSLQLVDVVAQAVMLARFR
jgi:hypothetical protein